MPPFAPTDLQGLRDRIRRIEAGGERTVRALPFGVAEIDDRLPGGGLALGVVHDVAEGGSVEGVDTPAAVLFVAGILARMTGPVLWCLRTADLFAPALSQVGLKANRVIYAQAPDEKILPLLVEEGLRHGGLAAVVGELATLPMVTSRRLQIAAERSGVTAIVLRRRRGSGGQATARNDARTAIQDHQPTAAVTRWRVCVLPSSPLPAPGIGRARWRVELVRCRGGVGGVWEMEGCDAEGRLGLPAQLADGSDSRQDAPVAAQPWDVQLRRGLRRGA